MWTVYFPYETLHKSLEKAKTLHLILVKSQNSFLCLSVVVRHKTSWGEKSKSLTQCEHFSGMLTCSTVNSAKLLHCIQTAKSFWGMLHGFPIGKRCENLTIRLEVTFLSLCGEHDRRAMVASQSYCNRAKSESVTSERLMFQMEK